MTQPARPTNPPMGKPASVPDPTKPPASASEKPSETKSNGEAAAVAVGGPESKPTPSVRSASAAAARAGAVDPWGAGYVWQLAVWAVTPPTDDDAMAQRLGDVRTILLAMVDQIAPTPA